MILIVDKLVPGDEIRVVSPSTSMALLKGAQLDLARERLENLGFKVTFGENTTWHDEFFSTPVQARIEDFHNAFKDPNVKAIISATGGYNAIDLLNALDYDLIGKCPKLFCGGGDITSLVNGIYARTGFITYLGPHFSHFGFRHDFEYTLESFLAAMTNDAPYELEPSAGWCEDPWHLEEQDRTYHINTGPVIIQEGTAEGTLLGGKLTSLNLLQGTGYLPDLNGSILMIEEDDEVHARSFDRGLQSLLMQQGAEGIKAIMIGRFRSGSQITDGALREIIKSKQQLKGIPVISNLNIGEVQPITALPVGGKAEVAAVDGRTEIFIYQ